MVGVLNGSGNLIDYFSKKKNYNKSVRFKLFIYDFMKHLMI